MHGAPSEQPTHANVRAAFAALPQLPSTDGVVPGFSARPGDARVQDETALNLVGRDLTSNEWLDLIKPISARVVFVNAASGSSPFLHKLSGRNRIVITAASSSAQQYETVFPEFFVGAFAGLAADTD